MPLSGHTVNDLEQTDSAVATKLSMSLSGYVHGTRTRDRSNRLQLSCIVLQITTYWTAREGITKSARTAPPVLTDTITLTSYVETVDIYNYVSVNIISDSRSNSVSAAKSVCFSPSDHCTRYNYVRKQISQQQLHQFKATPIAGVMEKVQHTHTDTPLLANNTKVTLCCTVRSHTVTHAHTVLSTAGPVCMKQFIRV